MLNKCASWYKPGVPWTDNLGRQHSTSSYACLKFLLDVCGTAGVNWCKDVMDSAGLRGHEL